MAYLKPWGPLKWVLPRINVERWALLGTISVEERCLATFRGLDAHLWSSQLLVIRDPDTLDRATFEKRIALRKEEFLTAGASAEAFADVPLLADLDAIQANVEQLLASQARNVVLDISAMPKRWFFPVLKMLLGDGRAENIVVTYASPVTYGEQLAENPSPIVMLPGFAGEGRQDYHSIVIGIGFEPLGLANLMKELRVKRIRMLFPFPPGPPGYNRNWMFVKSIEDMTRTQSIEPPDRQAIHMFDCPHIFDALSDMTNGGALSTVLAPYGPKPMSLAMCLFSLAVAKANKSLAPVYYAQPRRYAIDYSAGIRIDALGDADVKAYVVKLAGRSLYELQTPKVLPD
jgi:hypothetical protein